MATNRVTHRIQRSRARGWKAPPDAIYCGRPGPYGNPFPVDRWGAERSVELFRDWLAGREDLQGDQKLQHRRLTLLRLLPRLAGRPLMCWCPLGQPCHVDYLCEVVDGVKHG